MTAVDTNLLVYAHRADSAWHEKASYVIRELAESADRWAIPWPCVHEFIAIVTHPRIYRPPSSTIQAIEQVQAWMESPSLTLLGEGWGHWEKLRSLLIDGQITGPQTQDAKIASICQEHGVRLLLTADRDFGRFPRLVTTNPLVVSR